MSDPQPNIVVRLWKMDPHEYSKATLTWMRVGFAVVGVLALAVGAALAFWPQRTIQMVAMILGVYLIVAGALKVMSGIASRDIPVGQRALYIVLGVLYVICGFIMVRQMFFVGTAFAVFVGITVGVAWIVEGVMGLALSDGGPGSKWGTVYAVVSVIAGVIVCFSPAWSTMMLMIVAGVALMVMGAISIYRALTFGRAVSA